MSASQSKKLVDKIKSMVYLTTGGTLAYQLIYMKKDFNGYYENVIHPIAQNLNPEVAHNIGVLAAKYKLYPTTSYVDPPILETKLLKFDLSNPIGIAAGFDKQGHAVQGLKELGFALIEIGSVTPEPQSGNPKPRVFRLLEDKAVINRYGFNSDGHEAVYKTLQNLDKSILRPSILGVNLGKNKNSEDGVADYLLGIERFADVADYFVINISSPNTPGLRDLQKQAHLRYLLTEVNKKRKTLKNNNPPLFLKLSPDLTENERRDIAKILEQKECMVDGLILSNTTITREELQDKKNSNESGGLSGMPLRDKSTQLIKDMYKLTKGKIPIIGVGGIFSGADAYEKILAGASAVQIYTSFIYNGPPVVERIKQELSVILKENGYSNVAQAVGKGL